VREISIEDSLDAEASGERDRLHFDTEYAEKASSAVRLDVVVFAGVALGFGVL
jgi:hypothetical protein